MRDAFLALGGTLMTKQMRLWLLMLIVDAMVAGKVMTAGIPIIVRNPSKRKYSIVIHVEFDVAIKSLCSVLCNGSRTAWVGAVAISRMVRISNH